MQKRKLLAMAMAFMMSLSLLGSTMDVHAAENNAEAGLNVEFVETLDGIEEEALTTVSAEELFHGDGLQQNNITNFSVSEDDCIGNFQSSRANGISMCASENSITQSFSGTINTEGGLSYLVVTLAPGEILQASLAGPNNTAINYDLLLYTHVDDALGAYITDSSLATYLNTYSDGSVKSVEDGVSYINTSDTIQTYALIVLASEGYSSTETFSLTVSIDEEGYYDAAEPNDSPFDAVTVSTGVNITNCSLNVSNDQDWYVWNVPSTISGVSLSLSNSSYTTEVYYASGTSMVLVNPNSSGVYNLNAGYYYIRVYNQSENFTSTNYTLTFQPYGNTASTIAVTFNGDMGSSKVTYPEGSYYRFEDTLTPSVLVLDSSGYPVISQSVTLTWLSGSWNESTGNSEKSQTMTTDNSGRATFNLTVPTSLGYNSCLLPGAITFRHYYDIDGIVFQCGGATASQIVYHFSHSVYISS